MAHEPCCGAGRRSRGWRDRARAALGGALAGSACSLLPEPEPGPEETKKNWAGNFVFDRSTVLDFTYESSELVAAGHAACDTLQYDYGDGTFSKVHAAIARVQDMLGGGSQDAYEVVEVANRHLCEWSHLAEDGSMELPPLSSFADRRARAPGPASGDR
ncbi:hypothetical protein ACWGF2_15930 [Streptomyces sp. NPDC054919]